MSGDIFMHIAQRNTCIGAFLCIPVIDLIEEIARLDVLVFEHRTRLHLWYRKLCAHVILVNARFNDLYPSTKSTSLTRIKKNNDLITDLYDRKGKNTGTNIPLAYHKLCLTLLQTASPKLYLAKSNPYLAKSKLYLAK